MPFFPQWPYIEIFYPSVALHVKILVPKWRWSESTQVEGISEKSLCFNEMKSCFFFFLYLTPPRIMVFSDIGGGEENAQQQFPKNLVHKRTPGAVVSLKLEDFMCRLPLLEMIFPSPFQKSSNIFQKISMLGEMTKLPGPSFLRHLHHFLVFTFFFSSCIISLSASSFIKTLVIATCVVHLFWANHLYILK